MSDNGRGTLASTLGVLSGILTVAWLATFLLHLIPVDVPVFQWWLIPWFLTVISVSAVAGILVSAVVMELVDP